MERRDGAWMLLAAGMVGLAAMASARKRYSFRDKVVMISGGSRGLGLVLARRLADEGASLAICARSEEELAQAREDLERRGAAVLAMPCDVRNPEQIREFVQAAKDRFGRVDALFNVAGVIQAGPMETMTVEDFEEAMRVHFWAALHFINAVLPGMRRNGEGRIVNISSIGGKVAIPHLLPYCASKFALSGYSEGLRAELSRHGVTVTTVFPGLMRTGSHVHAYMKGQVEKEFALFTLIDSNPLSSISVESAARQILEAVRGGKAEVVLSLPAKAMALAHNLFPGLFSTLMGATVRALPQANGADKRRVAGMDVDLPRAVEAMAVLAENAARHNNEYTDPHPAGHWPGRGSET